MLVAGSMSDGHEGVRRGYDYMCMGTGLGLVWNYEE